MESLEKLEKLGRAGNTLLFGGLFGAIGVGVGYIVALAADYNTDQVFDGSIETTYWPYMVGFGAGGVVMGGLIGHLGSTGDITDARTRDFIFRRTMDRYQGSK